MGPTPAVDEIGRELAELRAAIATLTEAARRLDARTADLERLLAGGPAPQPTPPPAPIVAPQPTTPPAPPIPPAASPPSPAAAGRTVVPAGGRHAAHRAGAGPGRPAGRQAPSHGRHRSTGPAAARGASGRGASVGRAALSLAAALPWLFCVCCFAVAIGLIAVSTFG